MSLSVEERARLRAELVARCARGESVAGLSRELGVNPHTANGWVRRAGLSSKQAVQAKRVEYERLRQRGVSQQQAADRVGINVRTGRDWEKGIRRLQRGRLRPDGRLIDYTSGLTRMEDVSSSATSLSVLEKQLDPKFLTLEERERIADLHGQGATLRAIGRVLDRSASTIKREIDPHRDERGRYRPYAAHRAAAAHRPRPKQRKLLQDGRLRDYVAQKLLEQWSPEQISNTLRIEFPDDEDMRVSTETIYQALYVQARGALKREVIEALRTGRTRRKPRTSPTQRTSRFTDPMVMITDRPAEADDRAVPGHWEGDLIMGEHNRSAIVTLVERSTRYVMLGHLPGGHAAEEVRDVLVELIGTLPEHLRGSLTWDQGSEMAAHKSFSVATGVPVFFCDPASPWQRGSNENTNGLLRQYFPKGTDLSAFDPIDLEHVAQKLNRRPRKTLDWETPAQRLLRLV